jgi:hypothetical protein
MQWHANFPSAGPPFLKMNNIEMCTHIFFWFLGFCFQRLTKAHISFRMTFSELLLNGNRLGHFGILRALALLRALVGRRLLALALFRSCHCRIHRSRRSQRLVAMRAEVVLDVGRDIRVCRESRLDCLGTGLGINRAHNLDAIETALELRGRGLDIDLLGRENRTKLFSQIDLRDGKHHRDAAIGLGVLRADVALDNVARRVLDGAARGVNHRDLFRLAVRARELVLAHVKLKARRVVLGRIERIAGDAVLPRAVADHAVHLVIALDRVHLGSPALDLEANRVGILCAVLALGALLEEALVDATHIGDALVVRRLGAKPFLLLVKGLGHHPLVKVRSLFRKGVKLARRDLHLKRKLLVLLDVASGSVITRRLDVPLLAHVARRAELGRHTAGHVDPARLALATGIRFHFACLDCREVNLLKSTLSDSLGRHFSRVVFKCEQSLIGFEANANQFSILN